MDLKSICKIHCFACIEFLKVWFLFKLDVLRQFSVLSLLRMFSLLIMWLCYSYYYVSSILHCAFWCFWCNRWACGVIMFTLLVGCPPFWHRKQMVMLRNIMEGKYSFTSPEWADITGNDCKYETFYLATEWSADVIIVCVILLFRSSKRFDKKTAGCRSQEKNFHKGCTGTCVLSYCSKYWACVSRKSTLLFLISG